jgi:hypothetical protein
LVLDCFVAVLAFWQVREVQAQSVGVVGGVYIDPEGMLRESSSMAPDDLRKILGANGGAAAPSEGVSAASPFRKISLRRLEKAVAELHEAGQPIPADMRFLAGLTSVKYLFVVAEHGDVVLAGPAEGWEVLPSGDVVGRQSHRPVLQLDDLIASLRYAFASAPDGGFLGCSIEPTEAGLKSHAAYVRGLGSIDGSQLPQILQGMERAIGPQDIHVYGIDRSSRFALQMIAADYRLKRISLAHDPSPSKKVRSYLDLAEKSVTGGPQRQHRWWFVGHYDAIRHTADRLAFELEGNGLKVETAPTQTKQAGPGSAPKASRAAALFAELATKNFPELAAKIPAFGELQNLVGLAVVGELVRQQARGLPARVARPIGREDQGAADREPAERYRPAHFLNDEHCPIARFESPKQCPALANARFVKDQFWMFSVSGGVEIDPAALAGNDKMKPATGEGLSERRAKSSLPDDKQRWWWD